MSATADVIVVGLGAMGSAAVYHLARHGVKVIGIDRFRPPHMLGSSHGGSRIISEAYFEHPAYVPLVQHAYRLWEELARRSGEELFRQTGGLMIGRPESVVVEGSRRSAQLHGLAHEVLNASDVQGRYAALRPADGMIALWEPRAGILFPERCITAHLLCAKTAGAILRMDERVLDWSATGHQVEVTTDRESYAAAKLVIAAGPWARALVPDLTSALRVERQVQFWFEASSAAGLDACPIHLWEHAPGRFFYGFPDLGEGVKIAVHHEGEITDPEHVRREVAEAEVAEIRQRVRPFLPGLSETLLRTAVCLYTNTSDGHFLIDYLPGRREVLIVSPCSGHGFKFSAAIGTIVADLLLTGKTQFDLSLFRTRSR